MRLADRQRTFVLAGVAAAAALAVYLRSLGNDLLNWDDQVYVVDNFHITSLNGDFFHWAFTTFYAANWHPLTWISHAVDYALWGLDPRGHHLTGIVLHGLNTFLVVLLAAKLLTVFRERSGAAFPDERSTLIAAGVTGLLFGIHPLHVESVAWVSERKDLLCAFFYLMSLLAYADFARDPGKGGRHAYVRRPYLFALLYFALALLSKPMAVSLPVVLLILDWHPFGRLSSRKELRGAVVEKLPFVFLGAASAVVTVLAQKEGGALIPFDFYPFFTRVLVAFQSLMAYLGKMAWPAVLSPFYAYPKSAAILSPAYLVPILLCAAVTAVCMLLVRRMPVLPAAWGCYVVMLLPALGIVQVGNQAMADRYTYLPSLGPFFLAGLAASWAWTKAGSRHRAARGSLLAAGCLLLLALAFRTVEQTGVWKNDIVLWTAVIEQDPVGVPIAYNNRGLAYEKAGNDAGALADFTTAIELDPTQYAASLAYVNRGTLHKDRGEIAEARRDYDMAIFLNPRAASSYYNRAWLNANTGRAEEAFRDYDKAIELNPGYSEAYNNRGVLFEDSGQPARALQDYDHAIELNSYDYLAYANRGVVLGKLGRDREAVLSFTKALSLNARCALAYSGRSEIYRRMGEGERAAADQSMAEALTGRGGSR